MSASYLGMNAGTGTAISDDKHIAQSVADILGTPIGSLITLREYGAYNMQLIDQPMSQALRMQLMASSVMALLRWEPRAKPAKVQLAMGSEASAWEVSLIMARTEGPNAGKAMTITVPISKRVS